MKPENKTRPPPQRLGLWDLEAVVYISSSEYEYVIAQMGVSVNSI